MPFSGVYNNGGMMALPFNAGVNFQQLSMPQFQGTNGFQQNSMNLYSAAQTAQLSLALAKQQQQFFSLNPLLLEQLMKNKPSQNYSLQGPSPVPMPLSSGAVFPSLNGFQNFKNFTTGASGLIKKEVQTAGTKIVEAESIAEVVTSKFDTEKRAKILEKYRMKRKRRNYNKVRYHLRKKIAHSRPRVGGRFVKKTT